MNSERKELLIEQLAQFPAQLAKLVAGLNEEQLTTCFLDREWSVAQNVHHLADSHINAYIRCKLISTEDSPPLKGYDQDSWAMLADGSSADLASSFAILRGVHQRWVHFWRTLPDEAWRRSGHHSENGPMSLERILAAYVAHGEAHLDQIRRTLAAEPSIGDAP